MSTASNLIEQTWWILENQSVAGELITLTAGETKYALAFSNLELARNFLRGMNDPDLQIVSLETWVMKDAFLTAANILGTSRIMFDYVRGQQSAQSASLENLSQRLKSGSRV